ncbi:hypothetical protein ACP3P8_24215 [Pseudomonas aeruginosa]
MQAEDSSSRPMPMVFLAPCQFAILKQTGQGFQTIKARKLVLHVMEEHIYYVVEELADRFLTLILGRRIGRNQSWPQEFEQLDKWIACS